MDDHQKHLKAHAEFLHELEKLSGVSSVVRGNPVDMTVAYWLTHKYISESNRLAYPNARTAYEIQASPLAKELL